jgi:hypothetical protein
MVTDADAAYAMMLAGALVAIALCVWPGFLRVRARDLAGYWASPEGILYLLQPTGHQRFRILTAGAGAVPGYIWGARGLQAGGRAGRVELGGRRLFWDGGGTWTRQGVF